MLSGNPPFSDPRRVFDKIEKLILQNQPSFPPYFSDSAIDLIKQLLVIDPTKRLGVPDMEDIKKHAFFLGLDWQALYDLQIASPIKKYIQQIKPAKKERLRPIQETPMNSGLVMPNVDGFSYNQDALLTSKN